MPWLHESSLYSQDYHAILERRRYEIDPKLFRSSWTANAGTIQDLFDFHQQIMRMIQLFAYAHSHQMMFL